MFFSFSFTLESRIVNKMNDPINSERQAHSQDQVLTG